MKGINNILIFSYPSDQSAGIVAYDIAKLLKENNNNVLLISANKPLNKYNFPIKVIKTNPFIIFKSKVARRIFKKQITDKDYCFNVINCKKDPINVNRILSNIKKPDFIIAFFLRNVFDLKSLYEIQKKTGAPILLYFMDMIYLTGGCHYAWDCDGYKKDCLNCPAIIYKKKKELASENLKLNKELIDKMNIIAIAGSEQLYRQTRESIIFKNKKIKKILLGVNQKVFYKKDKSIIREKYNIPFNKFIILFGAVAHNDKRKGAKYLIKSLIHLSTLININNVILLSIGKSNGEICKKLPEYQTIEYGYINDSKILADMYNIANVFVMPSIQDSGPMMINQSIACGTPVVSFDLGVAIDLVHNGKTGYRVKIRDFEGLAQGLLKLINLSTQDYNELSKNCSKVGLTKCSQQVQLYELINLFNEK